MHEEFRQLLPEAVGDSELVIVVVADVRGFSAFSERVESVEAALYIKKVYLRILNDYFGDADFFKPTGDGLLIVARVTEATLAERSNEIVTQALRLVREFPDLVRDDPLINFVTPFQLGIGIARGAASRLTSGDRTLDYSGRVLNLASRLMDLARPEGVVIDGAFRIELLDEKLKDEFVEEQVYIRSLAEQEPRRVYVMNERTAIPEGNRRPLDRVVWAEELLHWASLRALRAAGPTYRYRFSARPGSRDGIRVQVSHPSVTAGGRRSRKLWFYSNLLDTEFAYFEEAGRPLLSISLGALADRLAERGVGATWPVYLKVMFPKE